jgi:hypothetical protein
MRHTGWRAHGLACAPGRARAQHHAAKSPVRPACGPPGRSSRPPQAAGSGRPSRRDASPIPALFLAVPAPGRPAGGWPAVVPVSAGTETRVTNDAAVVLALRHPGPAHSALACPRAKAPAPVTTAPAPVSPTPSARPSATQTHRPTAGLLAPASGMPRWLEDVLLAAGLLAATAYATEPVAVLARRRRQRGDQSTERRK